MNKDIRIVVTGTQKNELGEISHETTKDKGQYFFRNNTHYVIVEDEMTAQSSRYKFNHRYLEVVKNGDINAKLYFEAGKDYTSEYRTPFGRMVLTFDTSSLTLCVTDEKIVVSASYVILSDGNVISDNTFEAVIENLG